MTILVISDRAPSRSITQIISEQTIDCIVTLGDLEMNQIIELKEITHIPKLGVYGNHCLGQYFESLGIINMHLTTREVGGLTFGGFEGCVRYKDSKYSKMYTQEEAREMLNGFPRVDVMLAHCPPYGINDEPGDLTHEGYIGLREYCAQKKPAHLFHGHTYPEHPATRLGETSIHYIFGEKVVEI